jgi:histidine triad (HIT) family protein
VHRDAQVIAFRDAHPVAPVHILIVPVRHVASLNELHSEDDELLGRLFTVARAIALQEEVDQGGYRLVLNTGPDAGQSVFHVHLHLLGGRPMRWPPG